MTGISTGAVAREASRFERLDALRLQDPDNPALLADTAAAAFAEGRLDAARALLDHHATLAPLEAESVHLAGLTAMRLLEWDRAAEIFTDMLAAGADAPPVRFNAAWSLAMAKRFGDALALLDDETAATLPQAAALLINLLHDSGDLELAVARAHALIELHPEHRALNAAVSTLAIDTEDLAHAARCAAKAGDHPEALTTLGTLALGEDQTGDAAALFDRALRANPELPRAWVGRGLAHLSGGDGRTAAADLDKGAALFGDHLGSWIAAGWAHFIAGDPALARARFETALALDETFAESHGSLAVLDLIEGRQDEARRRVTVALRLDRECFSAALAATLLATAGGDDTRARRIFETAIHTPIDGDGRTIAQALARMATRGG